MPRPEPPISVARIGRTMFGIATVACGLVGLLARGDPRWFAAAGALGAIWWAWDLLIEYLLAPFGEWVASLFLGGGAAGPSPNIRPSLDDTVRLLESHIRGRASRQVEINAAIRLEEIYRTVKQDPERAQQVIRLVRERYPEAPELERYREGDS